MKSIVAQVTITDADRRTNSRTFTVSPIRIGSARGNDLWLRHSSVAKRHGEIAFDPGYASFTNRAWIGKTRLDDRPVKHGEIVRVLDSSAIVVGPFRIEVSLRRARARDDYRSRKVTPIVAPLSVIDMVEPYAGLETWSESALARQPRAEQALKTFAAGLLEINRSMPRETSIRMPRFQDSSELVSYLLDPGAPADRLDDLDQELMRIAGHIALHS